MLYKFYKYIRCAVLPVFILAAVSACTSDDDVSGSDTRVDEVTPVYITLNLTTPTHHATRAEDEIGDGYETGQDFENEVSSALVFFYQAAAGVNAAADTKIIHVENFALFTTSSDGDATGNIDRVYTSTYGVPIELGTYNIIVVANLAENDDTNWWNADNLTLGQVRDHVQKQAWRTSADGGCSDFLMAMADDVDPITLTEDNNSVSNAATVEVGIERVAVRIDYKADYASDNTADAFFDCTDGSGKMHIVGAGIVNDYVYGSYLLKRVAAAVDAPTPEYLGIERATNGVAANYVIDPLTSLKKSGTTLAELASSLSATEADIYRSEMYSSNWSDSPGWWASNVTDNAGMADINGWLRIGYTLENTTPGGTGHAGAKAYNTGVVFKCRFIPQKFQHSFSGSSYTYTEGQTFFALGTYFYPTMEDMLTDFYAAAGLTFANFRETFSAAATWENAAALAAQIPSNDPSGYGAWLKTQAEGKSGTIADGTDLSWNNYMLTVCGYSYNAADGSVKLNQNDKSTRTALNANGVRTYENGICYYIWWVTHGNAGPADAADNGVEGVMEHAVVRNTIYKLQVVGAATIGDDVPGDETLRVHVTVNDWYLLNGEQLDM